MYRNIVMPSITEALPTLAQTVLHGDEVGSRAGRVLEVTHTGITLTEPLHREILVAGRKANIAAQIAETMWVLSGRGDIAWLSHYLPRAADFSDDGETWRGAYGPRLRAWERRGTDQGFSDDDVIDQWAHVIDLLRANPLERRAVIAIYDPSVDTQPGKDIPCNNWLHFTSRNGHLDLHVTIRSNDLIWGWSGINQFEWSAMLEITAHILGVKVGALHFSTTSLHVYENHWSKARTLAMAEPVPGLDGLADSPRYGGADPLQTRTLERFDLLADEWFTVEATIREQGAATAAPQVDAFPDPMLRSWLQVLQWWWSGNHAWLKPLAGTRLEYATHVAIQPKAATIHQRAIKNLAKGLDLPRDLIAGNGMPSEFIRSVTALHTEKDAAYGSSWKKRGEMLGILANLARKVDRFGQAETSDETTADTAVDFLVYLAKYRTWLSDNHVGTPLSQIADLSDYAVHANALLTGLDLTVDLTVGQDFRAEDNTSAVLAMVEAELTAQFDTLETLVADRREDRWRLVDAMLRNAYTLARSRWETAQPQGDDYQGADVD